MHSSFMNAFNFELNFDFEGKMLSLLLLHIKSEEREIDDVLSTVTTRYAKGDTIKISAIMKNMLIILRPSAEYTISASSASAVDGEFSTYELNPKAPYIFFKDVFGHVEITITEPGYFNFSAVCLPNECLDRVWISNIKSGTFKLSDKNYEKNYDIENGKTYCVFFASGTKSNPPIYTISSSFAPDDSSQIYYSQPHENSMIDINVTYNPEVLMPYGFFKVKPVKGKKDRVVEILDESNFDLPIYDLQYSGWVIYNKGLSPWLIALIVVLSVLIVGVIAFVIYKFCCDSARRRGSNPEYNNLTELPVSPIPDKE